MTLNTCPSCLATLSHVEGCAELVCSSCGSAVRGQQERTRTIVNDHKRLGRFQLIDTAGTGAFGAVWKAQDTELGRTVAIKIPHAVHLGTPQATERFLREGRSAARLRHPGIVSVHEVNNHDGLPYLVADFIAGVTLADLLTGQQPACPEAADLVAHMAEALDYAHAMGVVHRDIKPSNVMLDRSSVRPRAEGTTAAISGVEKFGRPMIMDFGLAARHETEETLTLDGQVLGTPAYMSPEQAAGSVREVDARSDIYSLGVVLYQLLAGELPFRGNAALLMDQVLRAEPRAPRKVNPKIPRDLETITLKCLAKEPRRRYQTAGELAADLRRWLAGEPVKARPVGAVERLWRWSRRNPGLAGLTAAVLVLLVGVAVASTLTALHLAAVGRALADARDVADRNANKERAAREDAEKAQTQAEHNAEQSRERLVQLNLMNGLKLMEDGDLFGSLVWFAETLKLDQGKAEREEMHRPRLAAVLQQCPRLVQAWFPPAGNFSYGSFSADGRHLLLGTQGFVQVCEMQTGRPLFTLKEDKTLNSAAMSPDGRHVVTVSADNRNAGGKSRVRVWDVATGQALGPAVEYSTNVGTLVFSSDSSRFLLSVSERLTNDSAQTEIRMFDVKSGKPAGSVIRCPSYATVASLSADGQWVVTTGYVYSPGGRARSVSCVWDAATGKAVSRVFLHERDGNNAELSPDGKRLLTPGPMGTVEFWDVATGKAVFTPPKHDGAVQHASFSPDGGRIVTASADRTAQVWDANTGTRIGSPMKHARWVTRAVFSPEGRRVLTVSGDETVRLWDAASGEAIGPPIKSGGLYGAAMVLFSPDGRYILTGGREARLWDVARGAVRTPIPKQVPEAQQSWISPDVRRVATLGSGQVRVWDVASGAALTPPLTHPAGWRSAAFSSDANKIVTLGTDPTVRVWDAANGTPLTPLLALEAAATMAELSRDGRRLAVAVGRKVHVWNVPGGERSGPPIAAGDGIQDGIQQVVFSPDASRVLIAVYSYSLAGNRGARIWDVATGQAVTPFFHNSGQGVANAAFSPDGKHVFTANPDGSACVWDAATGRPITPLIRQPGIVHATFSPDGRWVATASSDWSGRVWDAATGMPITPPLKHDGSVNHCSFSADGQRVLTCSDDGTARVWHAATGVPLTPPLRFPGRAFQGGFSTDGRQVFVHVGVGNVTQAYLWDLPVEQRPAEQLIALAHLLAGQQLDSTGTLVPLETDAWRKTWESLHQQYPREFQSAPRETLAWHRREADAGRTARQWAAAVWHLNRLLDAEPDDIRLWRERAEAHAERSAWPAALADFSKYLALNAQDHAAWHRRGLVHARLGKWDEAITDFHKAQQLDPANAVYWLSRHIAHAQQGQGDQAGDVWNQAVKHSAFVQVRGDALWTQRSQDTDPAAASDPWSDVVAILPKPRDKNDADWWIWRARGWAALAGGEWQRAVDDFSVVLGWKKDDHLVRRARALAYLQLSQWDKADTDLTHVVEQQKKDWSAWYLRGVARQGRKEHQQAVADFSKAVELAPASWVPVLARGQSHEALKQIDKVVADYTQALKLGATNEFNDLSRALLLAATGDLVAYRRACAAFVETVQESTDPMALNNAAWVCVYAPDALGDLARAVVLAEKAVAGSRTYGNLNTLGTVLYRAGRLPEAIARLEEGMKLHGQGGNAWDWFFLAMAHHRLGHAREARKWLDQAAAWLPQFESGKIIDAFYGATPGWNHRVELQLFRREAEALIN